MSEMCIYKAKEQLLNKQYHSDWGGSWEIEVKTTWLVWEQE